MSPFRCSSLCFSARLALSLLGPNFLSRHRTDAGATARGGERKPAVVAATVSGKRNFSDLTARDTNGRSADSVGEGDTGHAADAAHPPATPKPPSKNLAYVNGVFLPADEARVSITDLGFLYGCGVVEEVLVIGGNCVRLAEHLGTVLFAADCLDLLFPISSNGLRSVCMYVIGANSVGARSALYIQPSFGTYGTRSRRLPPGEIVPSVVIHTEKLPPVPALHFQAGIALLPVSDSRYVSTAVGGVTVPYLSSSQLPVILALQKARSKNCVEALMIDHGSGPHEGTTLSSNGNCSAISRFHSSAMMLRSTNPASNSSHGQGHYWETKVILGNSSVCDSCMGGVRNAVRRVSTASP